LQDENGNENNLRELGFGDENFQEMSIDDSLNIRNVKKV